MFKLIRDSIADNRRKERQKKVQGLLTDLAADVAASSRFRSGDAFSRASGVALGFTVPMHTAAVAFPRRDLFPDYERNWEKPESVFTDLAAILAWRQCLALFSDIEEMDESDDGKECLRHQLMAVCGSVYPPSDRADGLMRKYAGLLRDDDEQARLRENYFMPPQNPLMTIHFMLINECLDGPDLKMTGGTVSPMHVVGMQMFAFETYIAAVKYFKTRALEIFAAHREQGLR